MDKTGLKVLCIRDLGSPNHLVFKKGCIYRIKSGIIEAEGEIALDITIPLSAFWRLHFRVLSNKRKNEKV